ncbi:MAG: lipoprotein-releasing ABC transporter permease subunit [Rhodospirillales bacterium]|jgi:lipoprotein-releasing system permease protein|nr:lipoprotein-releasing ABC transporter permease subunit [Rhodospirillales bacterium]
MVAMRYLRSRRREGFISFITWMSLLGIALGVATLIIVMAVMNGFRHELLSRILGLNGHLSVYGTLNAMSDFDPMAEKVRGVPGVVSVTPVIEGQVMATARGVARGAVVRGARPADLAARPLIADNIISGSLADFGGADTVLVGQRLANRLGLTVGDAITLISPQGTATAFGTVPRLRSYRIAATFEIGMYEYDSSFVFMPLSAAQLYFRMPDAVSYLEVMIDDAEQTRERAAEVAQALGGRRRIHDWQQSNASFFNAIQVERNVMFLILTLIIVVAAFNIVSSMIMLVKDKGRDIAILRTMGATRGMIMRIFLLSGASVGVIGTLLGFTLGLAFALNIETIRRWIEGLTNTELFAAEIYFLSHLPAKIDPTEVAAVVVMGLGLSFLATLYPSWRAARIDPVEALRYE